MALKPAGIERVIYEAGIVPAQHKVAPGVAVAILVENVAVNLAELLHLGGGENLVEGVENPADGALGNKAGGYHAIANFGADKAQFRVRMNHRAKPKNELTRRQLANELCSVNDRFPL
ncbi:hypothetical protein [Hymenobacter cellulosivorans]|uniref:Uncharacterized protein n=1 Tax=Hymenobacter cellulosivorans TaxID=2932249 RepID=A0ABY4F621_9BACT|nr:hypothetical protein [Hymenobacter cellulosivorans]UOQ51452.1 hypothetical protein MUN80_16980 [Hymenobacter cellulosivorans]